MAKKLRHNVKFASSIELLHHSAPLNAKIYPAKEFDSFVVETAFIETLPGFWLGGNIYRPRDTSKKYPAVLNPHGHWQYGRLDMGELGSLPLRYANLAMRGMVVFAYDMIGYNDTTQMTHRGKTDEHGNWYNSRENEDYNLGRFSLQLNNSIKALDFISSLPYVDDERIGCTGASGGGTQTYFLAAIDERIKAAAPINMASVLMQGGCICENTAFLRTEYCNMDYAMLTCPRPLFLAASDGDWTKLSETVEFPIVKSLYDLYGKSENFECFFRSAPHCYERCTRERVYDFFCRAFGIENISKDEIEIDLDPSEFTLGKTPDFEGALKSEEEIFATARKIVEENLKKLDERAKEEMRRDVFLLEREFDLDLPFAIDETGKKVKVTLGKSPDTDDTCGVRYYHTYNFAPDAKRVSAIVSLMKKYPDAVFKASGKSAHLCEIAGKLTGHPSLELSDIVRESTVIPGIRLAEI